MIKLFLIIYYTLTSILFLSFLYLDLKFRVVPISFFKFSYIIGFVLNFFEFLNYIEKFPIIVYLRVFVVFLAFSLSFMLYNLKIIGGSDGKLMIFIFFVYPIILLNVTVIFSFFLIFSLFFVIFFIVNLIINNIFGDNLSFIVFFNSNFKLSIFKKIYFRSFYSFFDYSDLSHHIDSRYPIKSLNIIYNLKKNKFQILCQIRPPLIVFIILSYYTIFFLN